MSKIILFSDSSCDLPIELQQTYDINTIPFYISFDQQVYKKEIKELSIDEFYKQLTNSKIFPKTSLPSVDDYMKAFTPKLKEGNDIICVCLSSNFSGSYQSAVNAKNILLEEYPNRKIEIINSMQATAGQGLVVLQIAKMIKANIELEKIIENTQVLKQTSRIFFFVDTLEYLQKGGRIGKASALLGSILNVKPLIQLKDGELLPYGKVRGKKKAMKKIIDLTLDYIGDQKDDYDYAIAHAVAINDALALKDGFESQTNISINNPISTIGCTIGVNTGPGVIGICCIKKFVAL